MVDLGISFTYSAETLDRARGSEFFWFLLAVLVASPLWVPPLVPSRLRRVSLAVRRLSAVALLIPVWVAGGVALNQVQLYPGPFFSYTITATAALPSIACVVAIFVLLASDAHVMSAAPPTSPQSACVVGGADAPYARR